MPELPEVEVTRRRLLRHVLGRTIEDVVTTAPSYFFLTSPRELKRKLPGRRVEALDRLGKYLLARLDDGGSLLLHLGMTGQLFSQGASNVRLLRAPARKSKASLSAFEPDQHTHLQLGFEDGGARLFFRDVRKFGKVLLLAQGQSDARLEKLGVDALRARGEQLLAAAESRRIPVKTLLLDQAVIAGIGNIYADEALFLAKVSPERPAHRLTLAECGEIVRAAQRVMRRSIQTGGSSISDYVTPDGSDGGYQNERKVYGREGEPCPNCKREFSRIVLGGRSTHFCATCQR